MKQHPYAEILRAIADGKEIEWLGCDEVWSSQDADEALSEIADTVFAPESYRVKPETISINGIEVPKPLAELQEETLFWPSFTGNADGNWVEEELGYKPQLLENLLKAGLLHSTYEAAAIHAKALISLRGNPDP